MLFNTNIMIVLHNWKTLAPLTTALKNKLSATYIIAVIVSPIFLRY